MDMDGLGEEILPWSVISQADKLEGPDRDNYKKIINVQHVGQGK